MNKTAALMIIALLAVAGIADAEIKGIKIFVTPFTEVIEGETYPFIIKISCDYVGAEYFDQFGQPTLQNVQLKYIDGATTVTTNCPDCDCNSVNVAGALCVCTTTQAIAPLTAGQESKEVKFVVSATNSDTAETYEVTAKPITVKAKTDEAVFTSGCKELQSNIKADGQHCWAYGEGPYDTSPNDWDNNKFECTAPVGPTPGFQVNVGRPCIVNCKESKTNKACRCYPVTACVDNCLESSFIPSCTEVGNFDCSASPEYNCAVAASKPYVRCDNTKTCKAACAQGCGRETTFGTKCDENCNTITCNKLSYTSDEKDNCVQACVSICKANEEVCNLMLILDLVAALIAAIMLAINGMKWIMSEDPESRSAARGGINYVIVGIIVVIAALAFVSSILGVSIICFFA